MVDANYLIMVSTAIVTICVYSYLYKVNPAWEMAQHIFTVAFVGHMAVMAIKQINQLSIQRIATGELVLIIPVILGCMLYTRFVPNYGWVTRYPLAVLIGLTAGTVTRGMFQAWIITSLQQTISAPLTNLNNIIILLGLVCTLLYFTFTPKPTTPGYSFISKIGRFWLIGTFGGSIAQELMSRTGSVVARFNWLFINVPYETLAITLVFFAYIFYDYFIKKNKTTT